MCGRSISFALLGLPLISLAPALAQCEQAKLVAGDAAREQYFGRAVSISGDVAVMGAPGCCIPGGPGAAYVFRRDGSTWVQEQKLLPSDLQQGSVFGWAVANSGDTIVVTAPGHSTAYPGNGAAYVFRYDGVTWLQTQKLHPSDGFAGRHLGWSVGLEGDVLAVGQVGDSFAGAPESGAIYVYRWNGTSWAQQQKLAPADLGLGDHFGTSVSVNGNVILGGAPQHDGDGAAYVYRWNGTSWLEEQKLTPSDAGPAEQFGSSVALDPNVALVGAYASTGAFLGSGAAYVYRFNGSTWTEEQKLIPPTPVQYGSFGFSVAVVGSTVLVAAADIPDVGTPFGVAYLYHSEGGEWVERLKLTPRPEARQQGGFGPVALGDRYGVLGAEGHDDACPTDPSCNSGAAYLYDIESCLRQVPAISTWGLWLLALSVLGVGIVLIRTRPAIWLRSSQCVRSFGPRCDGAGIVRNRER